MTHAYQGKVRFASECARFKSQGIETMRCAGELSRDMQKLEEILAN